MINEYRETLSKQAKYKSITNLRENKKLYSKKTQKPHNYSSSWLICE